MARERKEISAELLRANVGRKLSDLAKEWGCSVSHVMKEYQRHPDVKRPRLFRKGAGLLQAGLDHRPAPKKNQFLPRTDCKHCRYLSDCTGSVRTGNPVRCEEQLDFEVRFFGCSIAG